MFQGYDVDRYRLGAFVLSAVGDRRWAARCSAFLNYLVSAEAVSVALSGRAARHGGDRRHAPHPRARRSACCSTSCSANCSRSGPATGCSGSAWCSSASCCISPEGLAGIWAKLRRRWRPPPEESAAMSRRRIYEGLPLPGVPAFAGRRRKRCSTSRPSTSTSAASARSTGASLDRARRRDPRADRAERRGQDDAVQPGDRRCSRPTRARCGCTASEVHALPPVPHLPAGARALVPDHQPVQGAVDLREPAPVAAGAASGALQRLARHRQLPGDPRARPASC